MRSLLEPYILPEKILRRLWLNKLPNHLTQTLITWLEDADLDKLAGTADKICENAGVHNINAIQNPINVQRDQIQQLQSAIAKLIERLEAMSMWSGHIPRYHKQHSSWNGCRSQHGPKPHVRNTGICWCWYHHEFGIKAKMCTKPCTFVLSNQVNAYSD